MSMINVPVKQLPKRSVSHRNLRLPVTQQGPISEPSYRWDGTQGKTATKQAGATSRLLPLLALIAGYQGGGALDKKFGLSDMLAEMLMPDPDMPSSDMRTEDFYEGETEVTKKDMRMRRMQDFIQKIGL